MQIIGISAAALNTQPVNPVFYVKPVKPEVQAAQSTTILLAATSDSSQSADSQSTFMYIASSSGGITVLSEMMFSSSFSAVAGGDQSTSSFVESSSISTGFGTDFSYASASTASYSTGERGVSLRFDAMA